MRHQFVRLFLSIVLIAFAVIAVQCLVIFFGNWYAAHGWKNMVFEDFISSIRSSIDNLDEADSSNVMNMMISRTSERISGLLVRDQQGRFVLSLGTSPAGEQMPSPEARRSMSVPQIPQSRMKLSYSTSINYTDVTIPAPRYMLSLNTVPGTMIPDDVELSEDHDGADMLVSLPSIVVDQDIAGTIRIAINGETVGYLDVLVYRMDTYAPTLFAVRALLISFVASLPVALIVSAVLAAVVSRWNARSVKEIQQSLMGLSRGYFDVDLPKQNTEEMAEIAESIKALGKDLSRHQRSRKEWIRNISHDLNTPVTSLNILINGALDGVFPLDRDLMLNMQKENDALMQRIQSVAYYSYLLSPDVKFAPEKVSMAEMLSEASDGIEVPCTIPSQDTELFADPVLLSRALREILLNAAAYGTKGGQIAVTAAAEGGNTVITVTNSGHLPNPLPQFFEPWARGDSSRSEGGSGLGLPIVYQIMELHSGTVMIGEKDGIVSVSLIFPPEGKTAPVSHQKAER